MEHQEGKTNNEDINIYEEMEKAGATTIDIE